MNEREAMIRALSLAWHGWGHVPPNPMVGAVILRDGEIVGEGWHAEFGGLHAETAALARAGSAARGGTLVVTLEPCVHHGKQPPCVDAILHAGVSRVVYALSDPNPAARGGAAALRQGGVTVEGGLLAGAAAQQNAAFVHRFQVTDRPWVALKLATSVDSRVADHQGRSRWISGEPARAWVQWLRAGFDAILVGATTVAEDDPSLTVRGPVTPRVAPVRIVLDGALSVSAESRLVREPGPAVIVLTAPECAGSEKAAALRAAGVEVLGHRSVAAALKTLRARGIERLLVEGGGRTASAFVEAGCVDRFYRVESPVWLGSDGRDAFPGLASRNLGDAPRWAVLERRALGSDTLVVMEPA